MALAGVEALDVGRGMASSSGVVEVGAMGSRPAAHAGSPTGIWPRRIPVSFHCQLIRCSLFAGRYASPRTELVFQR